MLFCCDILMVVLGFEYRGVVALVHRIRMSSRFQENITNVHPRARIQRRFHLLCCPLLSLSALVISYSIALRVVGAANSEFDGKRSVTFGVDIMESTMLGEQRVRLLGSVRVRSSA